MDHIEIGYMDIPVDYLKFDDEKKNILCDKLIDQMFRAVDKRLPKHVDRIEFLIEIFESSLLINEDLENYEVCSVIRDTLKRLNDN